MHAGLEFQTCNDFPRDGSPSNIVLFISSEYSTPRESVRKTKPSKKTTQAKCCASTLPHIIRYAGQRCRWLLAFSLDRGLGVLPAAFVETNKSDYS